MHSILKHKVRILAATLLSLGVLFAVPAVALASQACGSGSDAYTPSIDIGCTGKIANPIIDATFAVIRFLTNGVGLIIIGSIIVGGIQYTASRGDPQATAAAIQRLQSTVVALVIFIFGYAILNYVIPKGFFQ